MRGADVVDPEVKVELLLNECAGPLRRCMVGRELNADMWCTIDLHHVPVVRSVSRAMEDVCAEGALGLEVSCVEHDNPLVDLHECPPPSQRTAGRSLPRRQ